MTSTGTPEVIAIAGAGDLGRYVCEEILKSPSFVPVILSRGVRLPTSPPSHKSTIESTDFRYLQCASD